MLTKSFYVGAVATILCASASNAGTLNVKNSGTFVTTTGISAQPTAPSAPAAGGGAVIPGLDTTGGGVVGGGVTLVVPTVSSFQTFSAPQLQQTVALLTSVITNPPAGITPAQIQMLQTQLAQAQAALGQ